MLKLLNVNKIEGIFSDIDGSTRGNTFGKKLPTIARIARLALNIPIIPVTGRDLNGWFLIKDYNKVFGTRLSTFRISMKRRKYMGIRKLYRPQNEKEIQRFIKRYGCIVTNNGGTISSLDGKVVFQHHPFTNEEKEVLITVFEKYFDSITSIDLGNPPGKLTLHYVIDADEERITNIRNDHKYEKNIEFYPLSKESNSKNAVSLKQFIKIFNEYRTSKVLIGTLSFETAEEIADILDTFGIEATSNEGGLAITTHGINKRSAIEWVARNAGIHLNHAVFIGNDHNDTPAFTHPDMGHLIFVGNPKSISHERLVKKYGSLRESAIIVETYDHLYKKLRPLLLKKHTALNRTKDSKMKLL